MKGTKIRGPYGNCPVQADGTIRGLPFYFRSRWDRLRMAIAPKGGNPVGAREEDALLYLVVKYNAPEGSAGWIDKKTSSEVIGLVEKIYAAVSADAARAVRRSKTPAAKKYVRQLRRLFARGQK